MGHNLFPFNEVIFLGLIDLIIEDHVKYGAWLTGLGLGDFENRDGVLDLFLSYFVLNESWDSLTYMSVGFVENLTNEIWTPFILNIKENGSGLSNL